MNDRYYDNLQRVNPGFGKPRFSRMEIRDILISVVVLAIAFTLLYRNSSILGFFEYHLGSDMKYVGLFGLCFVLVVVSFLFGALFFQEKNLRAKAFDMVLVLLGMVFLYIGSE